jgi:DNA modification methylase
VERAVRDVVESGIQAYSPPTKTTIAAWSPKGFKLESNTIWDFPHRGDWAVHKGDYRGNWPPQLARNLIEKYSGEGDLVADLFIGGGTTLIEAWLLKRQSFGLDLSKLAVQTTNGRLDEMEGASRSSSDICLDPKWRPIVVLGDALNYRKIAAAMQLDLNHASLVCVHPPYLNALQYTKDDDDDLSRISEPREFIRRMGFLANEIHRALPTGGTCAILMGDVRKAGKLISLGYETLNQFTSVGFDLQDIIIKTQHRDRSSEFYVKNDKRLLLSHEYLFILRKPESVQNLRQ